MRIKLTFPTEEALHSQCQRPLSTGVFFIPSQQLARPGREMQLDCWIGGERLAFQARCIVGGISILPERERLHSGMWIYLLEIPFVEEASKSWIVGLTNLQTGSQPVAPVVVPPKVEGKMSLPEQIWEDEFEWLSRSSP